MNLVLEGSIADVLIGRHPLLATLDEKKASVDGAYLLSESVGSARVTMEGFEGDRHAGWTRRADGHSPQYVRGTEIRNSRQVSLLSVEELTEMARRLHIPAVRPHWLGANLLVRGVPRLSRLPPRTRLYFPREAVLVVEGENLPCLFPGRAVQHHNPGSPGVAQRFVKAALHLRGLVAWVERPGVIRVDDVVRVDVPEQVIYSL